MGYLDPGLFGIISQIGVSILFVFVTVFMFFYKPIKKKFDEVFKKEKPETQNETETGSKEN